MTVVFGNYNNSNSQERELYCFHQANDRAVMAAYGFPTTMTESDCVARLLEMYQQLT